MPPLNPGSQDEAAWLTARAATLSAAGRARQRRHAAEFAQRRREEEASRRLTAFALVVLVACVAITLAAFAPLWWDLFRPWYNSALLLSVAFAPPLVAPCTSSLSCRRCGATLSILGPPRRLTRQLITDYSEGCLCHLAAETLNGLQRADPAAIAAYKAFKMPWYQSLGVEPDRAEEYCRMVCRAPLPEPFAIRIRAELERRAEPAVLFPLELLQA